MKESELERVRKSAIDAIGGPRGLSNNNSSIAASTNEVGLTVWTGVPWRL